MEESKLFQLGIGTVQSVLRKNGICVVRIEDTAIIDVHCQYAAGAMAMLIGFNTTFVPPVGTRVMAVHNRSKGFIVGCIGNNSIPESLYRTRSVTDCEDQMDYLSTEYVNENSAKLSEINDTGLYTYNDMLPGEFAISNALGVNLSLLTTFAKLGASELAKVETFLRDDLVRIVSLQFKHVTAFGEQNTYQDHYGLNKREDGTSLDREQWGPENDRPDSGDDKQPPREPVNTKEGMTGAWRYSKFIGHLGDFINMYVTDPVGTLADQANRSGKARMHINSDGRILIQSVADIVLERVCRIPVPVEVKPYDDEDALEDKEQYEELKNIFLKQWDDKFAGSDISDGTLFHTAYMLREYARWLNTFHSLAHFHTRTKTWRVPTEAGIQKPEYTNKDPDVENINEGRDTTYVDAYATIRIMRDGSIVTQDAYGSAIVMAGGNMQISATRNLFLEAAGDINMVAGRSFNIKARKSIEIVSVLGGITQVARSWIHNFCEKGSIWLRSDVETSMPLDTVSIPESTETDAEATDLSKPKVLPFAVTIEAPRGSVGTFGSTGLANKTDGPMSIQAKESIFTKCSDYISQVSGKWVSRIQENMSVSARSIRNKIAETFSINRAFNINSSGESQISNKLDVPNIEATSILASSFNGHFNGNLSGNAATASSAPRGPSRPVGENSGNPSRPSGPSVEQERPKEILVKMSEGYKPSFTNEYCAERDLVQSLSQQWIILEGLEDYGVWYHNTDVLEMTEVDVNKNLPFPGKQEHLVFESELAPYALKFTELFNIDHKDIPTERTELEPKEIKFRYLDE